MKHFCFLSLALTLLLCGTCAYAGDWAFQGGDPGYTKYSSDNLAGIGSFEPVYCKRFYSKFSAEIDPNYNFSTGVLVRNGQSWVISNDQPDNGNQESDIMATKFDWSTGNALMYSDLPGWNYLPLSDPGHSCVFHPNQNSRETDTHHCNFPALWAPDGRVYARRGGDQRSLGAMAPDGTWTLLPYDGVSSQGSGYDTDAFINYYSDKLIYFGGNTWAFTPYVGVDVSAAAWANGTRGTVVTAITVSSPFHGGTDADAYRYGDIPKAGSNVAVDASWSEDPTTHAHSLYLTATNLVTGARAWTKNFSTDTCGQFGFRTTTSDYWRFMATEDGKYIYYVRNGGQTTLHVDNIATGAQISTLALAANSDPVMGYSNNYVYIAGAKEQMKVDATTGAVIWRKTNTFSTDTGYTLTQVAPQYNPPYGLSSSDPLYKPLILTNDTMWWVDGSAINSGHLICMSTTTGTIIHNIDLAAMVTAKNANERLIAVNDLEDANGRLGVFIDVGEITDVKDPNRYTNQVKYQDLYLFDISSVAGDANSDGKVDYKDYILLEQNFGKSNATAEMGDFDASGAVDYKDYLVLENSFGKTAIPEPATIALLLVGGLALRRRR